MPILTSRIEPALPAQNYKSYAMRRPLETHWRKATCEEVECRGWSYGWETSVDVSTDLGQRQYDYLTHDKTRIYKTEKLPSGMIKFIYGPGFTCFRAHEHMTRIEREPLLLVTGGDYRGNPRGTPATVHKSREDWYDDFASHQERLAKAQS